jgi:hypothetical protein
MLEKDKKNMKMELLFVMNNQKGSTLKVKPKMK